MADDDGFDEGDGWDEFLAQVNMNLHGIEEPAPSPNEHTYTYGDVPIRFPYEAYRSQKQMMSKIIEGVTTGHNCLLESPTGTGKTAALLCALLGWQRDCHLRKDNCSSVIEAAVERMGGCTCGLIKDKIHTKVVMQKNRKGRLQLKATTEIPVQDTDEEDEASKSVNPDLKTSNTNQVSPCKGLEFKTEPVDLTTSSADCCPNTSASCASPLKCPAVSEKDMLPSPQKRPINYTRGKRNVQEEERNIEDCCAYCVRKNIMDKSRPPMIYYCTRTHSQIAQVVKQLKATAYKNTKMTILAGREPTCIHNGVLKATSLDLTSSQLDPNEPKFNIDEHCRTLKKNYMIRLKRQKMNDLEFYNPDFQSNEQEEQQKLDKELPICDYFALPDALAVRFSGFHRKEAWDLEDIKKEGLECKKCPFYGAHALHHYSDIVFGSYNYLLQPSIRDSANIKYINSVLVFDEAHNIEDICRDVFSVKITVDELNKHRINVDKMLILSESPDSRVQYSTKSGLQSASVILKQWSDQILELGNQQVQLKYKNKNQVKHKDIKELYDSKKLHEVLTGINLTAKTLKFCIRQLGPDEDNGGYDGEEEEYYYNSHGRKKLFPKPFRLIQYFKNIQLTLDYIFNEKGDGADHSRDFQGYLLGVANPTRKPYSYTYDDSRRNRTQSRQSAEPGPEFFWELDIICLNPALGFRALRNTAYSIIVASGTLTPLKSFASELDTDFAVTLQADHVIPATNVWATVISKGFSGQQELNLSMKHRHLEAVQDGVGDVLLEICNTVPNGVLVFFPSYGLMHKLEERWKNYPTGNGKSILQQITRKKKFYKEDSKDKKAFQLNMLSYKENVKGGYNYDGCVLFAVFRGKISEGIDFADEQARAVVTIGIPYSNIKAPEISSKQDYNNMRKEMQKPGENFLSGQEWYNTQAFRAMNQGFGRCVRHRDDWGALILIESRLSTRRHDPYISSWVRKCIKPCLGIPDMKVKLGKFIHEMQNKKPTKIEIEYEKEDELDTTELVDLQEHEFEMDSQDDQLLTQVASEHDSIHNRTTQQVPWCSTPLPDRLRQAVVESSPEYDFTEEVEEVMGSSSPISPVAAVQQEVSRNDPHPQDDGSDSSVDIMERTPEEVEDGNDSDREFFAMADILQRTANEQDQQRLSRSNQNIDEQNGSQIFDVSMPSAANSQNDMSQGSNISYHSE